MKKYLLSSLLIVVFGCDSTIQKPIEKIKEIDKSLTSIDSNKDIKTNETNQNKDKIIKETPPKVVPDPKASLSSIEPDKNQSSIPIIIEKPKEDIKPNNTTNSTKLPNQTPTPEIEKPFVYIKNPIKGTIDGQIILIKIAFVSFYHKYKIKLNLDTQTFYSLDTSLDLTKLNTLISYYKKNTKFRINLSSSGISDDEIDKAMDILKNTIPDYKDSYLYDSYYFVLDSNILEFVDELRKLDLIEKIRLDDAIGITS